MTDENVLNRIEQTGDNDNVYRFGGTVNQGGTGTLDLDGTWKIDGEEVTATAAQLNAIDSVATVANKSGSPMVAGALVYISGYDTTLDTDIVSLADADDATKKATLVLTEAIADNASGTAESVATVTGLNTNAFSAVGSLVYESPTAGEWTHTAPTAVDDNIRVVGVVKVKSATIGEISFFPGRAGLEHAAVYLANQTPGTAVANGAVILGASKEIATITTATITTGNIATVNATNIDAGADAVKGTIDIFPTTTARGKTTIACEDNAGATTTNITVEAQSGARVISIQDGGQATSNLLQSEGASTINGVQTYTVPQVIDANTGITAIAGGGQADATALTGQYNDVPTVVSDYDSVKLLTAVLGQAQTVKNSSANILSVFPSDADSINALAINLSVDIPAGGEVKFTPISDTVFETIEALYVSSPTTQTGGIAIKAAANAGNTDITITNASHGQATTVTLPDGGAAATNLVQSTAALSLAEADVLDAATAGTQVANKVVIANSDINIGVVKATELHIGATGSEVKLDATPAELNTKQFNVYLADVSTASSTYFVSPVVGTITKIDSVLYGTIATADAIITGLINGTGITDGVITIEDSGSAAKDVDTAAPSALNVVAINDVIEFASNGASTNAIPVMLTVTITL